MLAPWRMQGIYVPGQYRRAVPKVTLLFSLVLAVSVTTATLAFSPRTKTTDTNETEFVRDRKKPPM